MKVNLPGGPLHLHQGEGNATVPLDGVDIEWRGVSSPFEGRLAAVGSITFPNPELSAVYTITLTSPDRLLYRDIFQRPYAYEGALTPLYYALLDQEKQTLELELVEPFTGYLTAPHAERKGMTITQITFNVVSVFDMADHQAGGRWTDAGHQADNPGDTFFEFAGRDVEEKVR